MNIVAPAGNLEKLKAAIKAGASEVYLGLRGFGARRNNDNFGVQEILDAIDYAHARGVKTLLTLNTLTTEEANEKADDGDSDMRGFGCCDSCSGAEEVEWQGW